MLDNMFVEENRVASFAAGWPLSKKAKFCNPKTLAATGFFYVGGNVDKTLTACFMCKKEIGEWGIKHEPHVEHVRTSSGCPWLNLHLEVNRALTFQHWPPAHFTATGADFAKAGFYHNPTREDPDSVTCQSCGLTLVMESGDDPMHEHQKRGQCCAFVQGQVSSLKSTTANAGPANCDAAVVAAATEGTVCGARTAADDTVAPAKKTKRGGKMVASKAPVPLLTEAENVPPAIAVLRNKSVEQVPVCQQLGAAVPLLPSSVGSTQSKSKSISDMTGLEFLKFTEETEAYRLVTEGESKIARFVAQAALVRAQFVGEIERLEAQLSS